MRFTSRPLRPGRPDDRWRIDAQLRKRLTQESGAVLVMTAILLVAILGIAALAIDVGSYYQAQRQAQGAADAAALAGADAVAASGTAAATASASSTATINYPGATPTVTATSTAVTVNVATSTPSFFGGIFNAGNQNVSARAVASVPQASYTPCTSAGKNCWAVWASDTSCTNPGINISAGSIVMNGGIHSNGSITVGGGAEVINGTTEYGDGSGCKLTNTAGSNVYAGSINQVAPTLPPIWPIQYDKLFPACSASGPVYCTGPNGTPSYCDYSSALATFPVNSSVTKLNNTAGTYCIYGPGGTPSNPASYTGQVTFSGGGQVVNATYVCGSAYVGAGGMVMTAYRSNLIFYAATGDVTFGGGGTVWTGDTFAPNGTIAITAGAAVTNFLEGKDVVLGAGAEVIAGDGPMTSSGGGSSSSAGASLSQ